MKALVIDDSSVMRSMIRRILEQASFEVIEAGHGRAALTCLSEQPVDLVLVDWNMPFMSGLEFLRTVRADPEQSATPVLFVTAETERERMNDALAAGADDYLLKPFKSDQLLAKVEALVSAGQPSEQSQPAGT